MPARQQRPGAPPANSFNSSSAQLKSTSNALITVRINAPSGLASGTANVELFCRAKHAPARLGNKSMWGQQLCSVPSTDCNRQQ